MTAAAAAMIAGHIQGDCFGAFPVIETDPNATGPVLCLFAEVELAEPDTPRLILFS